MVQGKKHERSLTDKEIAAVLKARQGTRLSTKYQDIYRSVFRQRARLEKEAEQQRQRELIAQSQAAAANARRPRSGRRRLPSRPPGRRRSRRCVELAAATALAAERAKREEYCREFAELKARFASNRVEAAEDAEEDDGAAGTALLSP